MDFLQDEKFKEVADDAAKVIMMQVDKLEKTFGDKDLGHPEMVELLTFTNTAVAHLVLVCMLTMATKMRLKSKHFEEFTKTFIDKGISGYVSANQEASKDSLEFMENLLKAAEAAGLDEDDLDSPGIREIIMQKIEQDAKERMKDGESD